MILCKSSLLLCFCMIKVYWLKSYMNGIKLLGGVIMRTLSKLMTIVLLGIILISCGAKENIRIGFVGTLSGSNSAIGVAMRDGLFIESR